MDAHTAIEEWEIRPFEGLSELRSDRFSGAVEVDSTWLFLRDGEAIAAITDLEGNPRQGDVEAFDDAAAGTAHEAPNGAVAALAVMLALGGDVRGRYFTDDTPLSTVDETLSEGGFTGYVELSENVLSGDYYVVYEEGSASHVAFVGPSNRLLTGKEAEQKATDEVGIYSVSAVSLPDVDLPEPQTDPETATPSGGLGIDSESGESTDAGPNPDGDGDTPHPSPESESRAEPTLASASESDSDPEGAESESGEPEPPEDAESEPQAIDSDGKDTGSTAESEADPVEDSPEDHEEPDETSDATTDRSTDGTSRPPDTDDETTPRAELREEYETKLAELREEYETKLAELREERDRLRSQGSAGHSGGGRSLSATEALAETSLFVRTETRAEATLEDAHAGTANREELAGNLRIEYHTQFDESAIVDGEPFASFLESSVEFRFARWLVADLLFEIRSTDSEASMQNLYDTLPEIDRIGFAESVVTGGDGEDIVKTTFDVVARSQMGEPLVVANLDTGREPTRIDWMRPLIEDASNVSERNDGFAGAVAVTASFFDPDALGAAREATTGSLLSRDKRASFVKLGRKKGFHLCLVESRNDSFHLTVPEL